MRENEMIANKIADGKTYLGIELGSTRIKAVLIDDRGAPLASGSHTWENRLVDGCWTYDLQSVWDGLQDCVAKLLDSVQTRYGVPLRRPGAMGVSAMMHGYLAFGADGGQLVPFRTWRNTFTEQAAGQLTQAFGYPVPQRWSVAHLYQAVLNREPHVKDVRFLSTLAGYAHWKLSGQRVVGVGEASGMFPIDFETKQFSETCLRRFGELVSPYGVPWNLRELLPGVLQAGQQAGALSEQGARLLDPDGTLEPGVPMCPPEGDAGTGMVATNSIAPRTGNVSGGTSVFAMVVLEKPLSKAYPQIDLVTTPCGDPVGMVHCNNGSGDIDAWAGVMREVAEMVGVSIDQGPLLDLLFEKALKGAPDCGGLTAVNYLSGEHATGFSEGRPLFVRGQDSVFTLANFMRAHVSAAFGALAKGLHIMLRDEGVRLERMTGHGGLFKAEETGQRILSAAIETPVEVLETAGEGGPWGMAILASALARPGVPLTEQLEALFSAQKSTVITATPGEAAGFQAFLDRYSSALAVEKAAVKSL